MPSGRYAMEYRTKISLAESSGRSNLRDTLIMAEGMRKIYLFNFMGRKG
jgi:hypothetical protein